MEKKTAIEVKGITKTFKLPHEKNNSIKNTIVNIARRKRGYEIQKVLSDITFDIHEGDFFAIVGRNGSGKSTLLKLLAGIYEPDGGSIDITGKLTPFIELGVGFNPDLTGRENVFLNGSLLGFNRKEMNAMYDDIVAFSELDRFMDQKLKNYSSGMQVRLAFSIAIRAQTDILLLDEVLAVGDAAFQQKCFNYFDELKKQGKTVVFVSHDMSAVTRFCNRAVYIRNGDLIHIGTPEEVADIYTLDNLASMQKENAKEDSKPRAKTGAVVRTRVESQTDDEVRVSIEYENRTNTDIYVALSLLKDGVPIGEISSPEDTILGKKGELIYSLNTNVLNSGIYEVPIVLCRRDTRELLVVSENKNSFAVKGTDLSRGAALKLSHTWQSPLKVS